MPRPVSPASDIAVLAVGMDNRKLALLRMAFRLHHSMRYRLLESPSGEHAPDLAIVDVDSPVGWQAWEDFRIRHPTLPALIVAATPPERPPAVTLAKPLRVESLFLQLQAALRSVPVAEPTPATAPAPRPEPTAAPAPPPAAPSISIARFDPRRGLLGATTRLARQARPALLLADGRPLLWLRPDRALAQCLQPAEQLRELCRQDAPALQAQAADASAGGLNQPLPALLWQLAIWSSQGRLPAGIGADTPLRLRQWPNLTRLAALPDATRLSALLTKTPATLRIIVRLLRVDPEHACTFLAAAHALGLLDWNSEAPALKVISSAPVRPDPTQPGTVAPERAGFLSRLLQRVSRL
ncbi:hypothetical protein VK98_10450 [Chromobacterium sp. LK11]|uniref:hypothetical protein n=1 Tax=Chromobacterium sp. LK11 TaxID=1628212 RepID=UPI000653B813|nr:hypothetical protein [Chromobacterium sp. LK11]KMN82026.1 hypothetical protein VK98_10450 [Chromobacterium sp. LK11]